VRARSPVDAFEEFAGYCGRRLAEDKHICLTTMFDEIVKLGYAACIRR
jgi:hypothetical protein